MADLAVFKVPSLAELFEDDLEQAFKNEALTLLLNKEPKPSWVKENKYANNSRYLPIHIVEYLLRKLFQQFRIEITGQGTSFNGVWVTVRVHYVNPATGEWSYHDGIGAEALQVKAGTSPADLQNINKGAVSMAFPIAKSYAIKDACHHFGKLFGADLNRKDTLSFDPDTNIADSLNRQKAEHQELADLFELKKSQGAEFPNGFIGDCERVLRNEEQNSYNKFKKILSEL